MKHCVGGVGSEVGLSFLREVVWIVSKHFGDFCRRMGKR